MRARLSMNAMVVTLCVVTSCLHIYLYATRLPSAHPAEAVDEEESPPRRPRSQRALHQPSRPGDGPRPKGPRPKGRFSRGPHRPERSPAERIATEGIGRASKWDRRFAYSPPPPHNATFEDWLPAFGGACVAPVGAADDDDRHEVDPKSRVARGLPRDVASRVRDYDAYKRGGGRRRRLLSSSSRPTPFALPDGCAALHKRSFRDAYANAKDDDRAGDDADDDVRTDCAAASCLPNFFLIGASKSGTTTLYEALTAHPHFVSMFAEPHTNGETHVYSEPREARECALRAVRRALPLSRKRLAGLAPRTDGRWTLAESRGGPTYVVEYTPHYLVLPEVRGRLCASLAAGGADCGGAKFVAMLRDPAARAYSQYVMKTHMRVPMYNDRRTFWEAADAGMRHTARYAKCWDDRLGLEPTDARERKAARTAASSPAAYRNVSRWRARDVVRTDRAVILRLAERDCAPKRFHANLFQAYVLKSAYYYQLLPWIAGQGVENVHVLTLETFDADALERLLTFAGLPLLGPGAFRSMDQVASLVSAHRNVARDGGATAIEAAHRDRLEKFFRPMNRKLDALLEPLLGRPTGYAA